MLFIFTIFDKLVGNTKISNLRSQKQHAKLLPSTILSIMKNRRTLEFGVAGMLFNGVTVCGYFSRKLQGMPKVLNLCHPGIDADGISRRSSLFCAGL